MLPYGGACPTPSKAMPEAFALRISNVPKYATRNTHYQRVERAGKRNANEKSPLKRMPILYTCTTSMPVRSPNISQRRCTSPRWKHW